jgi:uncharacterized protein (DUF302 family)
MKELNLEFVKCKVCNHEIYYEPCANFIIFCPKCFKYTFLECEYGYGPVVPCHIYLGEKEIGIVTEIKYKYFLQTQYSDEKIKLKKTYLEALKEAITIIENKIKK